MKYTIQVSMYMYDDETDTQYEQWHYMGAELKGKFKLIVFEEDITDNTKLFDTATEAGAYVDEHFADNRYQFSKVRIVELEKVEEEEV